MARSLGFAAYRAFSRRLSRPAPPNGWMPRPKGEVLWLHAASDDRLEVLFELGRRVQSQRSGLVVLITSNGEPRAPLATEEVDMRYDRLTSDHPAEAVRFLDQWRPDFCIWAGADLMPNLISQTSGRGIPMTLIDIGQDEFPSRNHKWFPDLTRESLGRFETIFTTGPKGTTMLRRIGVPRQKITQGEPLRNGPSPPSIDEDSLSKTANQLAGRPVWLAAHVRAAEFEAVLAAHRLASRFNHRLLLVMTLADPGSSGPLVDALNNTRKRFSHWCNGNDIDDNTQVLISNGGDDLGLWYRMAPLTFMASSLTINDKGRSPLDAVALGSAILFGPHVTDHRETYSRLVAVGAGRSVSDADALGEAVIQLVAPDEAAAMALEGWQVVTEGAALSDHLVELVQDRLDNHART
ncbi:MAG: 3-deoxy-D-manno-octulosonic acid transferase [Rhodobacteraceae bacterium]|nr:3-deoxy-D-manno-octulosonic acid transferase [Paracoccaceae bacterium]